MMIQQPRERTKTYGDRRFNKTASTLWKNLPSETRNEQSLEIYLFRIACFYFMYTSYTDNFICFLRTSIFIFIIPRF